MSRFYYSTMFAWALGLALSAMSIAPGLVFAQDAEEVSISDNSFLVEEAYNQEPGVVQHIFNLQPAWERGANAQRTVDFLFTQEWPIFSQQHQFSYSIPLLRYDNEPPNTETGQAGGLGDIMLNYRYQLLNDETGDFVACAPRFSFIFPSGDPTKNLGNGAMGYQVNIPVSKTCKRWATHFNAGLTQVPNATGGVNPDVPFEGANLGGYNIAASAIYFLRPNFHLMLEQDNVWADELIHEGEKSRQFLCFVSPGFRWAPYTEGDTQWVLGLGLPIGVSDAAPDIGVFFYMSFEHRFLKKRQD
jgi:hypothetical protein